MRNKDYFKGKNILIAGFARSGLASANLLHDLGASVSITDNSDNAITRQNLKELKSQKIKIELGKHSRDFMKGIDTVIISPGLSNEALPILWAKEARIPVISEIELAWLLCPAQIIAITGTNGKTTVTTLVGKIIEATGKRVFTCGNIGKPFSLEVEKMRDGDYVSLEVSSFQLENIDSFRPKVSVVLNLSRNHLDRYSDMQEYLKAKKRIFKNQDSSDFLVLNYDDPAIRNLNLEAAAKAVYFKAENGLNSNQSAALAIAGILNIERDIVFNVFRDFKGVEHRMEEVLELNGVRFINDSKSTTTQATVWALNALSCPIILIAGGREKGNDYSEISSLARGKVKSAILIGEAKDRIEKAFAGVIDAEPAATLDEAIKKAVSLAPKGSCVLFSPMCKSFDMFSNYEERGKAFKSIVSELSKFNIKL
ncbi:MAG: UDP-N-acetylmuramoyl-L-alanine--D-glutamate ligase [Candidatus Omnitrophota bacterium]|jgi:UDP-N-acetylmuramoylalanine--D-glutamate ligase